MFRVGDVIRKLRQDRKWTVDELAQRAGVNKMTLSALERGGNFRQDTLDRIAAALNTRTADLFASVSPTARPEGGMESDADNVDVDVTTYTKGDIPVIAEGEASPTDTLDWRNGNTMSIEEWISRPADVPDRRAYAIVVRGDSMEPMFKRGMRLIISPNIPVGDGDVAYVHLRSGERLIKVVRTAQEGYVLESVNPAHGARFVRKSEVEAVHRVAYARLLR